MTISMTLGAISAMFPSMTVSTTFNLPIEGTIAVFLFYAMLGGVFNLIGSLVMPIFGGLFGSAINFVVGAIPQLSFFASGH